MCETCGTKMVDRGESANSSEHVIECPTCGIAFLLPVPKLENRIS